MKMFKKIIIAVIILVLAFFVFEIASGSSYKMTVNVIDKSNFIGVNPSTELLDFGDLAKNYNAVKYVKIANTGKIPSYMLILGTGEISKFIEKGETFFSVSPGEEKEISFTINIPPTAENKKYNGKIYIFHLL